MTAITKSILINGKWVKGEDKTVTLKAPYSGQAIAEVSYASNAQLAKAVTAAEKAFQTFRLLPSHKVITMLHKIRHYIHNHGEQFAFHIAQEAGKPLKTSRIEVKRCLHTLDEGIRLCGHEEGQTWDMGVRSWGEGKTAHYQRFPYGVAISITPFNFPLNLVAHKLIPALVSGNTVVHKPAPQTPLSSLAFGEALQYADLPPGVINITPCTNEVAQAVLADDRIKLLSFTGSSQVGWELKRHAYRKKVLLECGGNASAIVHSDADLAKAVKACADGAFLYSGQSCISVQQIRVHKDIFDDFLQGLNHQAQSYVVGDPLDEKTDIGCMISEEAAKRAESWITEAIKAGAVKIAGGERDKAVLTPTILSKTTPDMKVNCEEAFAPIVTVTPYTDFAKAIEEVNKSPFGLQAGVFTQDIQRIHHAYTHLAVGGVIVNDAPSFRMDHMPYGGINLSGNTKEGVQYAVNEMTFGKLMVTRYG